MFRAVVAAILTLVVDTGSKGCCYAEEGVLSSAGDTVEGISAHPTDISTIEEAETEGRPYWTSHQEDMLE